MVTKEEFINYLKENLLDYLPDNIRDNSTLKIQEVVKGNDIKLTGVMISEKDSNISPTLYVDGYISDAQQGMPLEEIAQKITDSYLRARSEKINLVDIEKVRDLDQVKDMLVTKIINKDLSSEYLNDVPHKDFGDLAIITQIRLSAYEGNQASITIRDKMLESWGVSFDELIDIATKNDIKLSEPRLYPMNDIMTTILFGDNYEQDGFLPDMDKSSNGMFVFSTEDKVNGAKLLNQPELLEQVSEYLDCSLIILPSSIHETIIVPDNGFLDVDKSEISKMIQEINLNEVHPDEVLADHPFFYSKEEKMLYFEKDGEKINMLFTNKEQKEKPKESIKDKLNKAKEKSKATVKDSRDLPKKNKEMDLG